MSTSIIPQDRVHLMPNPREDNVRRPRVNLQALDDELGEVARSVRRPERTPLDQVPDNTPDIGRLSADAVMATAEAAAKEVESLKSMVKELAPELEKSMAEMDKSLATIAEAAKQVRDRGERTRLQVQAANDLAKDIAAKCAEFSKMVNGDGN
jgi:methyl-accepting chemotaxis protein